MNPKELRERIFEIRDFVENINRKVIREKIVEIKKTTRSFLKEKRKEIKSKIDSNEIRKLFKKIEKFSAKIKES